MLIITGEADGDRLGASVAGAGDFNGDGYADVIVGDRQADAGGTNRGRACIIYGDSSLGGSIAAGDADVIITGEVDGDLLGMSVSGAGDVDGDGFADVIVGTPDADAGGTNRGRAYIIHGDASLSGSIPAGDANVIITGEADSDTLGGCVAGAGDINGDGFADVIVGARGADGTKGRAYIIYGGLTLAGSVSAGSADVIITGEADGDYLGTNVASAGDVKGDGFSGVIVGARDAEAGGNDRGRAYIIYGDSSLGGSIAAETADVIITGEADGDMFGISVADAGMVEGFESGFNTVQFHLKESSQFMIQSPTTNRKGIYYVAVEGTDKTEIGGGT